MDWSQTLRFKMYCSVLMLTSTFTLATKSIGKWSEISIVYKKTDEWYIEWQRVKASGTTSDNEWQRVVQRVTTSGTTSDKEWQRMTKSDNEW